MTRSLLLLIAIPRLASSFTAVPSVAFTTSRRIVPSPVASAFATQPTALFSTVPEPGACPSCSDEGAYWDGGTLFVCIACGHEWPSDSAGVDEVDDSTRDVNGNILERGDTVVLVKDLGKGLKKGTKVKNIRLGDYGDGHDIEANIAGMGTYALKSQFLKKV